MPLVVTAAVFFGGAATAAPRVEARARGPCPEPLAGRELSRGVQLPAVGRGQLQDLQPRDLDTDLFRDCAGVCVCV
jgi:hypothetical protein